MKKERIVYSIILTSILVCVSILSVYGSRTITSDSDTILSQIQCSNGNVYDVSSTNLQTAINSFNNQSGFIQLPACIINTTTPIRIATGCHLNGVGNDTVIRLANDANTTIIKNFDQTNGNDFIKISNLRIEGNCGNQDVYIGDGIHDPWWSYTCGIWVKNCEFVEIYSVTINGTRNQGILADKCRFVNVHDCFFTDIGISYDGTGYDHYAAEAVYYYNTTDSVLTNCICDNAYSCGFVVEGYIDAPEHFWSMNVTVADCVVTDTGIGYYTEDASFVVFDGCVVSCGTDNTCFGANTASGFRVANDCKHITISDCIVRDTYRGMSISATKYLILDGNRINDTRNYGISSDCNHSLISDNSITYTGSYGMTLGGHNVTVSNNYIYHCGQWAAGIGIVGTEDMLVIGNRIIGAGGYYPNIGIYGTNTDVNSTILFNVISDVQLEIYQISGRINCTGYDDWNIYNGVS